MSTSAPSPFSASDFTEIKRKSIKGGTITLASQGISIVIGLASTIILARLLSPADYGVVAMVLAVTAFAGIFRDLGLSAAAIQKKDLTPAQQTNLFWINLAAGTALALILACASPLVATFYRRPEVLWVTVALAANFIITSFSAQSTAALLREMRFGRQAVASIAGALVSLILSVVLALNQYRYWALVWGQLAGSLVTTILLFSLSPFRPGLPTRDSHVSEMLRFGAHVTAFEVVNYFQRNLDKLLLGRYWGAEGLGLYNRAYSLLMFPINSIRGPINRVAFPGMSRCQVDPAALRNYFQSTTTLLAFASMPLTAWLFTASEPVIEIALGQAWLGAAPIFSILAAAAFIQPVSGLAGSLLLSLGQGKRYLQCGLFNTTILSIAVVIGLPWGTTGVAAAYAIGNYVVFLPWLAWAFRESPVRLGDFLRAIRVPAVASLGAVGVTQALLGFTDQSAAWSALALRTAVFATAFILFVTLQKNGRTEIARLLRFIQQLRLPHRKDSTVASHECP